jgi:hypothetical protein
MYEVLRAEEAEAQILVKVLLFHQVVQRARNLPAQRTNMRTTPGFMSIAQEQSMQNAWQTFHREGPQPQKVWVWPQPLHCIAQDARGMLHGVSRSSAPVPQMLDTCLWAVVSASSAQVSLQPCTAPNGWRT